MPSRQRPVPFDAVRKAPAPSPASPEVAALIDRAARHELGLDFLLRGAPNSIAATFGVHAFVVDAARDHLRLTRGPGGASART